MKSKAKLNVHSDTVNNESLTEPYNVMDTESVVLYSLSLYNFFCHRARGHWREGSVTGDPFL